MIPGTDLTVAAADAPVLGWDEAVQQMSLGEKSILTISRSAARHSLLIIGEGCLFQNLAIVVVTRSPELAG